MKKKEIENLIKELIEKTTIDFDEIIVNQKEIEDKNETIYFEVNTKEPHFFLNKEGEALFALNHIAKRIIESKIFTNKDKNLIEIETEIKPLSCNITIDINGFQKKRIENIRAIVHMMAERARYFKSNIEIEPMSSYERRIVHEFLSNAKDLKTESQGFGRSRRVVIKYIGDN